MAVRILKDIADYKAAIVTVFVPILALPLLFIQQAADPAALPLSDQGDNLTTTYSPEATCCYAVVVMSAFWMFEVMPLAATALIPTFLFPILGIMPSKTVCTAYLPDTNFLFIGGLIVAVAVERCNLHQRIALRTLTLVGSQPKWIMLGFMSVTAFLSMWISNTATTAMMVPIAQSVIQELLRSNMKGRSKDKGEGKALMMEQTDGRPAAESVDEPPADIDLTDTARLTKYEQNIAKGMLICIAFAANIGGTGTITGTPPNLVTVGILTKMGADGKPGKSYYSDATSAMLIAVLMFVLPSELPDFLCFKKRDKTGPPRRMGALMDWKSMQEKFPWSVVLLLGGGFALAAGVKESGLSSVVGNMLEGLGDMDVVAIQFIVVLITMFITNICSNTVTASIFVPIVAGLLVLPVALACSFAFALPVATPPNAIVFASGILTVADMMKSGLLITVVSAVLIVVNQQTYARLIFPLDTFPDWANATIAAATKAL